MAPMQAFLLTLLPLFAAFWTSEAQMCPGSSCFGCSPGTDFVTCSSAGLTGFPELPLDVQQTVEDLILESNSIDFISATDLQNFTSLRTLILSLNTLMYIEPGSFDTTGELRELLLDGNDLTEIPDSLFVNTRLRELDLSNNDIQNISAATFNGLTSATINLADNLIRTFPNDTFSGINFIQAISLTGNPLRCDCELSWLPAFFSSVVGTVSAGTCNDPPNLRGVAVDTLTEDQFVCECVPSCVNGTCDLTVGVCECDDGFVGIDCGTACSPGTYGAACLQNCSCMPEHESSPCDIADGTCNCQPGYTGSSCELECPEGFYGQDCQEVCQCQNGASCDFITGMCNCTAGWTGVFCDMMCSPGLYGLGCAEVCGCETGNCHHITGECTCPVGYFGTNCSHNCTEASDENCFALGRESCSLETPEQTCGPCLPGHVGEAGDGNTECILCSGAPNCMDLNRDPCSEVANTCGPCFRRHLGTEGFSNDPCFDPCIDGIQNFNETDVDCGGSLCPTCEAGQQCTTSDDCGLDGVCLGVYIHPSMLDYSFNVTDNETCVAETFPGISIIRRFQGALQGRENPLPFVDPLATLSVLESNVEQELLLQFNIPERLDSIKISELEQAAGDPLYQTSIQLSDTVSNEAAEESFNRMVENVHSGKLKGTTLLNRKSRKTLFNF